MKRCLAAAVVVVAVVSLVGSAHAATRSQREALESARSYLRSGHFSKAGLIHQLTSRYGENFPRSVAVWAVARSGANWRAEAVQAARSYLRSGHFSRRSLIHQLESRYGERFTHAQAVYAVNKVYR